MVTLECLDAFDHLLWLRTGARAAEALGCNQSTISRSSLRCQQVFGISVVRRFAEWVVVGDTRLLDAERLLHQNYRWDLDLPLRLDCQHWLRALYGAFHPSGWINGNGNYLEYERPLALLQARIIDAWLCTAPDIPSDPELSCVQLTDMPMHLVARQGHPLLQRRAPLTIEAVAAYPLLPLPQGAFPVFEAQLAQFGLSAERAPGCRADIAEAGEGVPIEDLCLGIASPPTLPLYGPDWQVLPLELPIRFGDVLVIRAEFAEHPRAQALLAGLMAHLRASIAPSGPVHLLGRPLAQTLPVPLPPG